MDDRQLSVELGNLSPYGLFNKGPVFSIYGTCDIEPAFQISHVLYCKVRMVLYSTVECGSRYCVQSFLGFPDIGDLPISKP
jgi:hypothetical protein